MSSAVYLDIETDWHRNITVLGFWSSTTGVVQLVGTEVTAARVRRLLARGGRLYTFNGHCFDLPVIRKQLGLDLRTSHNSIDLRYSCADNGLTGGQKAVEKRVRFSRALDGVDGLAAIRLWRAHQRGAAGALPRLLAYNREDLAGLRCIRKYLSA